MPRTNDLMRVARSARRHALAPFSGYRVGAAVRTKSGKIISGCNVEVPVLGLGKCAEQVALFSAIAQGHRRFTEIAVATPNGGTPCGACRQVIWDLCGDIPVHVDDGRGGVKISKLSKLMPEAFDSRKLNK